MALLASFNKLTVVQWPPSCVLKPAEPFDGTVALGCSGNSTLTLMSV